MADPRTAIHYGMPAGPAICGDTIGERWTAVRKITCDYCRNIIDLFIGEHFDQLLARREVARGVTERKERPPT